MKLIYWSLVFNAFIVIYVCIRRLYEKLFSKPNLLNVAVTRARHDFYLIGDYHRLKSKPYAEVAARELPLLDN